MRELRKSGVDEEMLQKYSHAFFFFLIFCFHSHTHTHTLYEPIIQSCTQCAETVAMTACSRFTTHLLFFFAALFLLVDDLEKQYS